MSIASRPVHVDLVHRLEEPAARDPAVTGSKAAAWPRPVATGSR